MSTITIDIKSEVHAVEFLPNWLGSILRMANYLIFDSVRKNMQENIDPKIIKSSADRKNINIGCPCDLFTKNEFDVLIVDRNVNWIDIVKEALSSKIQHFDIANNYDELAAKLDKNIYKVICLNRADNWYNIITMLKKRYPLIPIIMLSSNISNENASNIRKKFPNIKKIIYKGLEPENLDFVTNIRESVDSLITADH